MKKNIYKIACFVNDPLIDQKSDVKKKKIL